MNINKKMILILFTILLTLSLAGCNTDSLGEYKKASEKTGDIKKGQTSGEYNLILDIDTEGMAAEEIKELNYYKDMKGTFNVSYDDTLKKGIYRNYINFGGLGFDFDLYKNGDEIFMKLPVVGKYVKLDELGTYRNTEQNESTESIISKESKEAIAKKWVSLMKKEDVFKGKDIILTTPDGEVKTTEYTIKLNDEQIKKLFADSMDVVSKDENLKDFYQKMQNNIDSLKDKTFEESIADIKDGIKYYKVESFSYVAYVDIDGYIVNQRFELKLNVNNEEQKNLLGMSYSLDIKNWDINKEQNFNFPILTDDNTLKIDNMNESMPIMIEDMFK